MIAVFLGGAAVLLLLSSYIYSRTWSRALSVRVLFSQPHIYANECGELTEEIENRKKQSVPIVEIGFRIPMGLVFTDAENIQESDYVYKRDLFAVEGMERIVRHYQVRGLKRGYYRPDQLSIHAPSYFFRHEHWIETPPADHVNGMYVYARLVDCGAVIRMLDAILGERESMRRMYEDPLVFASIRQYTMQDPMKTINWKASAKTGELMVNTYASVTSLNVCIFLDVSADVNIRFSEDLRELAIAGAASLARDLAGRLESVSLVANVSSAEDLPYSEFRIGRGGDALTGMEEFLASDRALSQVTGYADMLERIASEGRWRSRAEVYVFFSGTDTPLLRERMHRVLDGHGSGIFVPCVRSAGNRGQETEGDLFILPFSDTH